VWRKLSPSAELMADPGCEICDTGYWRPEKAATIGLLPYSVELSSGGEAY